MQTLEKRNTYAPTNASQVRSNCDLPLNKEETFSVAGLKTFSNTPEVNQLQQAGGLTANVPVLSLEGKPLMPCRSAKARKLLRQGKAKVVKRSPFVIQLNFKCENQTQEIIFGEDTGYGHIGFSIATNKKELVSGEVVIDNKTTLRLIDKQMYRRGRRNKLRYRKPRFLNRKKKEDWLPPSVQRRVDTHIALVEKWAKWIPITKVDIELGSFDIQKILNPTISGTEYQQGNLYEYENQKAFVIAREQGKCQLCGKEKDKEGWHLHHIIEKTNGGTDKPDNIALLHKKCHKKLHSQKLKLNPNKQFKAESFMSVARKFICSGLKKKFKSVKVTFGYETKIRRNELKLQKSHINDAFVTADGNGQERCKPLIIIQKHRNNRSLGYQRKGFAPTSRRQRYKIQPLDLIWVNGLPLTAKGCLNLGKSVLLSDKKTIGIKHIEKVYNYGSFVY